MAIRQRILPLALSAFAVVYLWQARLIELDPWSAAEAINARTLPIVYGVILLVLGLVLSVRPGPPGEAAAERHRRWVALPLHAAVILGFAALIPYAGLWIAAAALLLGCLLVAGERRLPVLALAPAATAGAAWLLIAVVLDVYVDPGLWFG